MCQALAQKQKVLHIPHDIYLMRWGKIHLNLKLEQWVTMKKMVDLLDSLESASKQLYRVDEPILVQFLIGKTLTANIDAIANPELQMI
uniref:Uncharacterized protein n=1 Tax=Ditylenchus dipsaci TaxID=166011 RepID=A0A915DQS8_9BILA